MRSSWSSEGRPDYGASEIDRGCPLGTGVVRPIWHASGTQARMILHGQQTGAAADQRQRKMNGPVQVATDGACLGNPGPGGWAWTTGLTDASGDQQVTTNQEMELRAILEALRAHPDQAIVILTDSQYAIDCVTTWLPGWRRRGWRTSAGRPVKHQPIIEAIAAELDRRTVQLVKVPGHAGHPLNERADRLAAAAAARAALPRQ